MLIHTKVISFIMYLNSASNSHLSDAANLNLLRPICMNDLVASVAKTKASKVFTGAQQRLPFQ